MPALDEYSGISSSLINQISAAYRLSILNSIYYSLEYIRKNGIVAQKQIRVVIFRIGPFLLLCL